MLSRVADSLYWMARYLERAEHTSRLIAVKLESMIEQTPADAEASWIRVVAAMSSTEYVAGRTRRVRHHQGARFRAPQPILSYFIAGGCA